MPRLTPLVLLGGCLALATPVFGQTVVDPSLSVLFQRRARWPSPRSRR